jgi:hypothetical protein
MKNPRIVDVLDFLTKRAAEVGASRTLLADYCGLHRNTIIKMGTKDFDPSFLTIQRLEEKLLKPVSVIKAELEELKRQRAAERESARKQSRTGLDEDASRTENLQSFPAKAA